MENLIKVGEIITKISGVTKKNEKELIIRENKDNPLFQKVLNHLYNPHIKTNIAKKKLTKKVKETEVQKTFNNVEEYMEFLTKCTGKDEQIAIIQRYILQNEEVEWILKALALKNLKIGATESTINKAFGYEFIPEFEVMLAKPFIEIKTVKGVKKVFDHWKKHIGKRVIVTKKLDGYRATAFVNEDGSVNIYSREGFLYEGCVEIEAAMSIFPKGHAYDGEILATNKEGLSSKDLYKKTQSIMKTEGVKRGLIFNVFDLIPIKEFKEGLFKVECEKRKGALSKIVNKQNSPFIKYVEPLYVGEFKKEVVDELNEEAQINKEEGVMCQVADSPYECKRVYNILKVKSFRSADVKCIGIYEGKSEETAGKLGGVVLDFKGHSINVGSGFRPTERIEYWKDPDKIVDRIVEIKYFEEFTDENGHLDLRFASFKTVRIDKTEPSYN
ncbi:hypothetical protein JR311_20390 (plasmid) [Bacillus velezensis]|uniref:ATP-dependent DNA ligase n=1 Tax=Bacillus velezensis TaxID=492670 RepID=UPI001959A3DE|nr:hypothetical protein [Bacillus velezensis]QRV11383.1 hypothetical protein JR311_20390 [Bacillus velezensis]